MKAPLFLILLFLGVFVNGQKKGQSLIDSIVAILPAMKEDTFKVKSLAKISETYVSVDPARGIEYSKAGLTLSEKLDYKRGISRFENLLGLMVGDTGNNIQARIYFERSYTVNKQIGYSFGMISNLSNIGRSYQRDSDYSQALDYFFKALAIAEENKINEQIALVGTNITSSFFSQKNYVKALEYAEMTLRYARLSNTPNNIGKALFEIGNIKQETNDSASAARYMDSALSVYEDMDNKPAIVQVLSQKATLLYPDYNKAISQLLQVQKILDETNTSSLSAIGNAYSLGTAYYELALQSSSPIKEKYLDTSATWLSRGIKLTKNTSSAEHLANMYRAISNTEEARNNYALALSYLKSFYAISDSLYSQDKKNELAGLETKYKITEKDNEITLTQIKLISQQRTQLALVIGLILLGIIGALLFWQNKLRKKSNSRLLLLNNQLDETNQVKLKFFSILSHDFRTPVANLINYLHLLKNAPDLLSPNEINNSRLQIGHSAEDLLQTLETTLLWSKEQMVHFKPDIRTFPISELFSYLQKFFTGTELKTLHFSNSENLSVSTDENYLKVIMQNLTSNALKALRNQSMGSVEWMAVRGSGQTRLIIRDNGPGMPEDQLRTLFEEGIAYNTQTGYGFHLIRDLAKAIHLHISVESKPGEGTTFTLSL